MPHLIAKIAQGHSDAQKKELGIRLTAAVMVALSVEADAVSITLEEVPEKDWMDQVYRPDIQADPDSLLKRPAYGPLASPKDEQS